MLFSDRMFNAVREKRSRLTVGLDPHVELLPPMLLARTARSDRAALASVIRDFCIGIIEAVHDIVAAVKPQVAFFERLGPAGYQALEDVVAHASARDLIVISDCKRGDIGSTAAAYADYHLGFRSNDSHIAGLGADAVTLNPYLGADSVEPFMRYLSDGRGLFILAKTSNKGSADLQDVRIQERQGFVPVYQAAARLAQSLADRHSLGKHGYSSIGLVVGATFPSQARGLRSAFPTLPFLIPGVGAQGATALDIRDCFDETGLGAIVNASRSVLFAYREGAVPFSESAWKEAARGAAIKLRDEINAAIEMR